MLRSAITASSTLTSAAATAAAATSSNATRQFHAIVMGPPGGGKGTISSWLVRDFQFKHLSSGDLLRKQIAQGTELGRVANEYIKKGALVPDSHVLGMVLAELASLDPEERWLLDGFPRSLEQAKELDAAYKIHAVINLDVPHEEITERIKHRHVHIPSGRVYHTIYNPPKQAGLDDVTNEPLTQREDDKEEAVRARLVKYSAITQPLVHYYQQRGTLHNFPGTESKVIYPEVAKYLKAVIPPA
ncbi:GTP:AMP Phosphotransferase, variant [Capsaspora owczarzaki ATCC 30864]|uniref:GTP:AMP phosphotransferase, mitochondrial n=1 Tax=Capsaspora owczarzaki (strain ATCC 30864) TaxID=595528 RepID=A0A0D2VFG5_CAPO3|nr:GTP:AMP Phosphotransferase, variant [Capsaspora owczarzaki ATCC 30864]KJE88477.1 GTP:AMP Phosphotransferase [Capsaspora owczarzaki ATCC 30864]|eukprot:XP_011269936.1 GTP:AMP Phosphotransferase, variant [Capsaspora owczarzaki ATCC 30864]